MTSSLTRCMARYSVSNMLKLAYAGVDPTFPGNGGLDCMQFSGPKQRVIEVLCGTSLGVYEICYAYKCLQKRQDNIKALVAKDKARNHLNRHDITLKKMLLVVMCLAFGIELGFKFATKQLIFLLNPCHIATMLQIYVLTAPPSELVVKLFRVQWYMLHGATLALIFPVINTRVVSTFLFDLNMWYFVLTVLMYNLIRFITGVYTLEPFFDFNWAILTIGALYIYHFLVLQGFGLLTYVNLSNTLCPAITDPFYGPQYRFWAILHQGTLVPLHGKALSLVALICNSLLFPVAPTSEPRESSDISQNGECLTIDGRNTGGELPSNHMHTE
ncbi:PREDICTED: transmembrane protein 164-like [Priapulus caudatus]|uniref:Transmembrane protein 164-like n=1 Tax=Priapulus caudatus TaxID=37621 RepID=A0ABM1ENV7_PRICU|nr:PREDICTED: transmembrane protein 164-like [Priapulus caudatus]